MRGGCKVSFRGVAIKKKSTPAESGDIAEPAAAEAAHQEEDA